MRVVNAETRLRLLAEQWQDYLAGRPVNADLRRALFFRSEVPEDAKATETALEDEPTNPRNGGAITNIGE